MRMTDETAKSLEESLKLDTHNAIQTANLGIIAMLLAGILDELKKLEGVIK